MSIRGVVSEVKGRKATVIIKNQVECEECEFSKFCRVNNEEESITCRNEIEAEEGDIVEVVNTRKNIFLGIFLNFFFPISLMTMGIFMGVKSLNSELAGFLLAIGFTVLYFLVFMILDKKILVSGFILPEIRKVLEEKD